MFKGFGKPNKRIRRDIKQFVDVNLKGYGWLQTQLSNDKEASQRLAQFVMRCLGIIKDNNSTVTELKKLSKNGKDNFQMEFARMLTYSYYTQMAIALAEFEPTGVEGMSVSKTVDALCEATDEQLENLNTMFA